MTVSSGTYDPYMDISRLGVGVEWGNPGAGNEGIYFHDQKLIILKKGLNYRKERCVLAHEIVHAEFGDTLYDCSVLNSRIELRADRLTAKRLVNIADLNVAMRTSQDPGRWCLDLNITPNVLENFFRFFRVETEDSFVAACPVFRIWKKNFLIAY